MHVHACSHCLAKPTDHSDSITVVISSHSMKNVGSAKHTYINICQHQVLPPNFLHSEAALRTVRQLAVPNPWEIGRYIPVEDDRRSCYVLVVPGTKYLPVLLQTSRIIMEATVPNTNFYLYRPVHCAILYIWCLEVSKRALFPNRDPDNLHKHLVINEAFEINNIGKLLN